ncbi:glycosyl transferase [Dunaliella salina]|uniref:Glycosyl transferase n=1 Tax=Dunaliella salina TaxID=3046 RepID=A0ABQ7GY86_DUNSA|nr:glycosyl transferase [Dunaliella salina]|eukprot:KAF5839569.1 glycosyl transferase [Dunaliella salina]
MKMKKALVTVGTTKFEELVRAVDSPAFAEVLQKHGFQELVIQTGTGRYLPRKLVPHGQQAHVQGLLVRHLNFTSSLTELMSSCCLIISHAGSGSIFEALTCTSSSTRLVVVPNPNLMDNHQAELGQHLAAMGHLLICRCI